MRAGALASIGGRAESTLWSSPLLRARQTAEIVVGSGEFAIDDRLREFDYGTFEGLTTPEIKALVPGWTLWEGCPGGESMADVAHRVDSFLGDARAGDARVTVVFAHGHLLRIFAARVLDQPGSFGRHLALDTGSLSEIDDLRDGPAITRWNDVPRIAP